MEKLLLFCRDECLSRVLFARMSCAFVCIFPVFSPCLPNFPKQVREARRIFNQGCERLGCANQMSELL